MENSKKSRRGAAGPGFFITFEGPEGAGKSSQLRQLAAALQERGVRCVCTREPGGTPLAEAIRAVVKEFNGDEPVAPETELLLMEAARAQHVAEVIHPALEAGMTVLCDRFGDSTSAYQGAARGIDREIIARINRFASRGRGPDLTFVLDIPPEVGFRRNAVRSETRGKFDRFEREDMEFHRKVRRAFLDLAASEPDRIKVIDADRPAGEVHAEVLRRLAASPDFAVYLEKL